MNAAVFANARAELTRELLGRVDQFVNDLFESSHGKSLQQIYKQRTEFVIDY